MWDQVEDDAESRLGVGQTSTSYEVCEDFEMGFVERGREVETRGLYDTRRSRGNTARSLKRGVCTARTREGKSLENLRAFIA